MPLRRLRSVTPAVTALATVVALGLGVVGGKAVFADNADDASGGGDAPVAGTRVDVIVKATNSEFWQSMLAGSKRAGHDLGLRLGLFGPTAETDIEPQIQLVEDSISRGAQAIVLAANSSTALNGVIDKARKAGVRVITVDNAVTTETEGFLGTDNIKAGQQAGQRMCRLMTARGHEDGAVLHETSVSGVQVLGDRFDGFKKGLAEKCPHARVTQTLANNNDVNAAVGQVSDALTKSSRPAGIFADNNVSGIGTAKAVQEKKAQDSVPVVSFDSDPAEIAAVKTGAIDAIVVQNPYFFGYQGVVEAVMAKAGSPAPANLDPGAVLVDGKNVADRDLASLLNPPKVKK
ncbi:ABC transporter substrate-binding protein [Streptomyces sp. NPDC050560]|uniref:ABC transporter substrate-binding protein n=1 Tax=Streptomyces sp. NPDC050560 TaxID=3365630 RepID=UPI0037BD9F20